jgi:hypothetical protein
VGDHEPSDGVACALSFSVIAADGELHVAAERDVRRVATRRFALKSDGLDAGGEALQIVPERERDTICIPGSELDGARPSSRDADGRGLDVERRVNGPKPCHRRGGAVEFYVFAAQEVDDVSHIGFKLSHSHGFASKHLHRAVTAADRECGAAAGDALYRRHRVRGQQRMAQRYRDGRPDAQLGCRRSGKGKRSVRVGQETVGLAHRQAVPAVLLHLASQAPDAGDRHRRSTHPPQLRSHGLNLIE